MRLYFLDNIKVALISLVVIHHAGQAYGPTDYWPIQAGERLNFLGPIFDVNGAFFMGLFFMISAYFLPTSLDRKGARRLLRDRLIRLGVPLLFMVVAVFGPITYWADGITGNFWRYMIVDYIGGADFEVAHLWFVSLLLFFTLCYLVGRYVMGRFSAARRFLTIEAMSHNEKSEAPSHVALLFFTIILGGVNGLVRHWIPLGIWVEVVPLMPIEIGRLPQYIAFFGIGLIASRRGWLLSMPIERAVIWGGAGVLAAASVAFTRQVEWLPEWLWLLQEAVIGVGFCTAIPVVAREFWNRRSGVLKRLSDNAFAVYLIHILVIYVLQEALELTTLTAAVKFAAASLIGLILSFSISDGLRRIPQLQRIL
ncbi:acyltransferase family protein [Gilvimarinus sp. F26214L]|uniref:acyltransferase family protein n=1 Tax=Gilvimarinus sp. DZF01 TaxID=3461371 RepID=UPI0040462024